MSIVKLISIITLYSVCKQNHLLRVLDQHSKKNSKLEIWNENIPSKIFNINRRRFISFALYSFFFFIPSPTGLQSWTGLNSLCTEQWQIWQKIFLGKYVNNRSVKQLSETMRAFESQLRFSFTMKCKLKVVWRNCTVMSYYFHLIGKRFMFQQRHLYLYTQFASLWYRVCSKVQVTILLVV